jgi:hypothetical protein
VSTFHTLHEGITQRSAAFTTPRFRVFVLLRIAKQRRLSTIESECDTQDLAANE